MDAIDLLAAHFAAREAGEPGQQSRLAKHLGVTPALVHQWLRRLRPVAASHARGIEEYTGGSVTRYMLAGKVFGATPAEEVLGTCERNDFRITPHELRPDLYPNAEDGLPDAARDLRLIDGAADMLTAQERADLISAFGKGPAEAVAAIDSLDINVATRRALLEAASRRVDGA
jgi:DNA-binding transcriptional regulator YdaS (Cro superfamily)